MRGLYNFLLSFYYFIVWIVAFFNSKAKKYINGRLNPVKFKNVHIKKDQKVYWFHSASLGEFEQARTIIDALKEKNPELFILVTFYSPSGYEVRKNYKNADFVTYLPFDLPSTLNHFIKTFNPEYLFLIKYEFWPNLLNTLYKNTIPIYSVSSIFREDDFRFKWYGKWFLNHLKMVNQFFVQDENSKKILEKNNLKNIKISGDTRFDRVLELREKRKDLPIVKNFKQNNLLIVYGSTWVKDEELIINFINQTKHLKIKHIIAPHVVSESNIQENIISKIEKKSVLYSEADDKMDLSEQEVLIIDNYGLLSSIFYYSDIAYVGGGFTKTGIHNCLEPATYGNAVFFGENFKKFQEAKDLIELKGAVSITNHEEYNLTLNKFIQNPYERNRVGEVAKDYVLSKSGGTKMVLDFLREL